MPDALVQRDDSGSFAANSVSLDGNLNLPATAGTIAGNVTLGGVPILSGPGGNSFITVDTAGGVVTATSSAMFGAVAPPKSTACSMPPGYPGESPLSAAACSGYCTAIGSSGGTVTYTTAPGGCFATTPPCSYISDFATCDTGSDPNGPCDSCPGSFVCTCSLTGASLTGSTTINGPLQVSGYVQLGATSGSPPLSGCDGSSATTGRMVFDSGTGLLWICAANGWISK
jgi:hypothetical protein